MVDTTEETVDASLDGSSRRLGDTSVGLSSSLRGRVRMPDRGTMVGRYVVVDRLGSGAMGLVLAAYDPELDRKVALKLLRPHPGLKPETARGRLQREAQVLAKVSHPNVVAVHDVGLHEEQVFVAMEFVHGKTLRQWMNSEAGVQPRAWQQIVQVFMAAGKGLAAAHAQGLVHRDFKPDNVMVGNDGRVVVMDFGLARAAGTGHDHSGAGPLAPADLRALDKLSTADLPLTQTGMMTGTPAYMAPEQFMKAELTAQTDQFAFCVALFEALYGMRPFAGTSTAQLALAVSEGEIREPPRGSRVPRWLWAVARRGLSTEPQQRYSDMASLLEALGAADRRRRRTRLLGGFGAIAVLATGTLAYQQWARAKQVAACEAQGAVIDATWNEDARSKLREAVAATGVEYAETTARGVVDYFDAQASAWRRATTQACLDARVRGQWNESLHERASWCLQERRLQLQALLAELTEVDETTVATALTAASKLSSVEPCRDERRMKWSPAPPDDPDAVREVQHDVSQAEASILAGKYEEAVHVSGQALDAAQSLGWAPLRASARLRHGIALGQAGKPGESEDALERAFFEAARAGIPETEADAATALVRVVGISGARYAEGRRWAEHARVALLEIGEPSDGLRMLSLQGALAELHRATGDYDEARQLFEEVLSQQQQTLGAEHPAVAGSTIGLAHVYFDQGHYDQAQRMFERALELRERSLSPVHPDVADVLDNLGTVLFEQADYAAARKFHQRALELRERVLGPGHPHVAVSLNNLANLEAELGNNAEARRLFERVISIDEAAFGPEHPSIATAFNNLAVLHKNLGQYQEAVQLHRQALSIRERVLGPDHRQVASSLMNLATVYDLMANFDESRRLHERAVEISERALGPDHPELAQALGNLANLLARSPEHDEKTKRLYERAMAIHERALGPNHPVVAGSLYNLANLHHRAGELEQAKARFEQARVIWEAALGPEHRTVALALHGLALVAVGEGRPADAVPLAERALALRTAEPGPVPPTAESRFILAQALWDAPPADGRDRDRARTLAAQALEGYRQSPGWEVDAQEVERWLARHQ